MGEWSLPPWASAPSSGAGSGAGQSPPRSGAYLPGLRRAPVAAPHAPQAPAPALPRAVQTPGGSRAPGQRSAELPREPPLRSGAAGRSQTSSCACTVGCGGQAPNGDLEEEDRPWEMVGSLKVCAVEAAKYPGNVGIIKLP